MAEIPGVELSFDDGPDGSNDDTCDDVPPGLDCYPLRNTAAEGPDDEPFDPSGPRLDITLEGGAIRTGVGDSDAKFGRAIELSGGTDAVKVTNLYDSYDTPDLHAYWALDQTTSGVFWREECRFEVGLDAGEIYIDVYLADCVSKTRFPSGVTWPGIGSWHHLTIHRFVDGSSQHQFGFLIDSVPTATVATIEPPDVLPSDVYFGRGIDGRVDELQAAKFAPGPEVFFDYDAEYCGKDAATDTDCVEKVAFADGSSLTLVDWDLPVRYKIIYDTLRCTALSPCRVVFALSGGGSCADNYPRQDDLLNRIVERDASPDPGLAVVAVDPICWAFDSPSYPDEVTQMLAVKAALASESYLDLTGDYYALGCSHGANIVLEWAVLDLATPAGNRPKRVFVRSPADHGAHVDCEYHESWCGEKQELFDTVQFGIPFGQHCQIQSPWPHPHTDQCVQDFFQSDLRDGFIENLTGPLVADFEVGRSWGTTLQGAGFKTCGNGIPSETLCVEEGGFAATDGGRQFRDRWRSLEPAAPGRTGYFIENDAANCQHCSLTSEQLDCVVEYLDGGRSNLSSACLALDVEPGEPAADCSIYPL